MAAWREKTSPPSGRTPEEDGFFRIGLLYVRTGACKGPCALWIRRPPVEVGNLDEQGPNLRAPKELALEVLADRLTILGNPYSMTPQGPTGR